MTSPTSASAATTPQNPAPAAAVTQELLEFWFSSLGDHTPLDRKTEPFATCYTRWYGKDPAVDNEVRSRFLPLLEQLTSTPATWAAAVADYAKVPHGPLALLLLVDQLPRNMFRDTARMYAYDTLAAEQVPRVLAAQRQDDAVPLVYRLFAYVPLMHVEDLAAQQRAVDLCQNLVQLALQRSPQNVGFFEMAADFARRHQAVIEQFGRFPHRNAILGRDNSAEEVVYLAGENPGF